MKKFLICDNDKDLLELLQIYLEQKGYDFFVVYEGREVLPTLKDNEIKLLILDLNLPDIHGREIIKNIREDPNLKDVQILLLTGSVLTKNEMDQLDVNGIIEKPFEIHNMEEMILEKLEDVR